MQPMKPKLSEKPAETAKLNRIPYPEEQVKINITEALGAVIDQRDLYR